MRFRHVIWDWNGTLLDDAPLCVACMNEVLGARGLAPLTLARYQEVFDFPVERYYRRLPFDFSRETFEEVGAEFMVHYERRRTEAPLRPGAREALDAFTRAGVGQSVLSGYRHDTLEELLVHFGLRERFAHVLGSDDIYARGKVAQGRALVARLGVEPARCLVIGDTTHDAEVAREIGADGLLLPAGHQSRARLEACGFPVVDSLADAVLRAAG